MSLDRKITDLLPGQIPDYVQEFYPMFVIFITKYYEWLEQDGNPQQIIQNITLNRDIDTTASSLATKFMATYAPNLPQETATDRASLIKHFRDFYRAKGSDKSFEYFFRAFFEDEIKIKLPGDQLFKTSDGNWYVEKTLRVVPDVGNIEDLLHTTITGADSGATGVVEKIVKTYDKWDITLQNRSLTGTFSSSETITGYAWDFVTDQSSLVSVINTEPLQVASGRQLGTNSLLSSDQVVQDSIYWQKFSYVIKTRVNLDRWKDAVLEQIHPTGRNMFGELNIDNTSSLTVTSNFIRNTTIDTTVKLFGDSNDFYVVPGVTWDRLANFKTGTSTTTTAGAVTFDANYRFGGENVTFALQGVGDAAVTFYETLTYTSVTGTVSIDITTGNTTVGRDQVTYVMPNTSITGTLNAIAQVGGDEITFTGTGTLFSTELPLGNNWRYFDGTRDAGQNPIYSFYSSVLTIKDLAVTGTLTIAAQTPVAPNYYVYVTGTSTRLQQDLLVTGTSATVSREIDRPILDNGQDPILFKVSNMPMSGIVSFNQDEVTAYGNSTFFIDQMVTGSTVTITKPLSNRVTQVSSIPASATSYQTIVNVGSASISGSSLTSSFSTSQASATFLTGYGYSYDNGSRYDIPSPFTLYLMGVSSNTLRLFSPGVISLTSSAPVTGDWEYNAIHVLATYNNMLNKVYYGTTGSAPNREFKVYYDGTLYRSGWSYLYNDLNITNTSATIIGSSTLGTAMTMTTGTTTGGYVTLSLPWSIWYSGESVSSIHVAHNSNVGLGSATLYFEDNTSLTCTIDQTTSTGGLSNYWNSQVGNFIAVMNTAGDVPDAAGNWFNPDPQKMVKLYAGTVGTAPNRQYVVRYEGHSSTAATAGNIIWEMTFNENDLSSVTINSASPADATYSMYNVAWCVRPHKSLLVATDGTGTIYPYYSSEAWGSFVTSSQGLTYTTKKSTEVAGSPLKWEATFYENSSSGITIQTGALPSNRYSTQYRYGYGKSGGQTYTLQLEFSETSSTSPSGQVSGITVLASNASYNFKLNKYPSQPALYSSLPTSSGGMVLFQVANTSDAAADPTYYNYTTKYINTFDTSDLITSTGAVYRWPKDGWYSTTANPNPNPTCSSFTFTYGYYTQTYTGGGGWKGGGGGYATNWWTVNKNGYVFTYGSSQTAHSRYLIVKPLYGRVHRISGMVFTGNGYGLASNSTVGSGVIGATTLAPPTTSQSLQLWYSTADTPPNPPTPGQSPAGAGWTLATTLMTGSANITTSGTSTTVTYSPTVVGENFIYELTNSTVPRNCTWMFWESGFSPQTTSMSSIARLSEFAVTDLMISSDWYNQYTPNANKFSQSSIMPRIQAELASGATVRVQSASDRSGNTVLVDYTVISDPADRGYIDGNMYFAAVASTSTPLTGYINSWYDTTSATTNYGSYYLGIQAAPAYIVENKTIDKILSETSFTVTSAFKSTTNSSWATQVQSATATRAFSVVSVPSSNSVILGAPWSRSTLSPVPTQTTGVTAVADRRFTITAINSNTDITVSGGGIYANFTGKSSVYPKIQSGNYTFSGYHDLSNVTSATQWVTVGFPGYADSSFGTFLANEYAPYTTIKIGDSSFTLISVVNDTTIIVTGSPILTNFYDTSMVSYFPSPASSSTMIGTGTKFNLFSTSYTISANTLTLTTEEVTVYDGLDRKIGFIRVNGNDYRITSIENDTTMTVTYSIPLLASVSGATGNAYRRTREYGSVRQVGRAGSATFDKAGASIKTDESLITTGNGVDFTKYKELYHSTTSLALASSANIVNTSVTIKATSSLTNLGAISSYLLLVTWMKDLSDNASESLNELRIGVSTNSANATIFTWNASDEIQRNSKDIALGRTIMYSDTVYVNSSNSIVEVTATPSPDYIKEWDWTPYSKNRSGTYSRFAVRIGNAYTTANVSTVTLNVSVTVSPLGAWNSTSSDFLNVTVIGLE